MHFENNAELPESISIENDVVRVTRNTPRRARGTIFARDLIGCSAKHVTEELGDQVTEVIPLSTKSSLTHSGRFLLTFPATVPDFVLLHCGRFRIAPSGSTP